MEFQIIIPSVCMAAKIGVLVTLITMPTVPVRGKATLYRLDNSTRVILIVCFLFVMMMQEMQEILTTEI